MTERREPTISAIASDAKTSQPDEHSARHTSRPSRSLDSRGLHHERRPTKSSGGILAFIAFLVALAGVGGAVYLYQQLQLAQRDMRDATARIVALESKLELSDDESSASVTALQAKIKWADSEIRKLWGVAYDTNRKTIKSQGNDIATLQKNSKTLQSKIDKASRQAAAAQKLESDIQLVNDLVDAQQLSLTQLQAENTKLKAQVSAISSGNAALQKRIKNNEQAIEAIDAFRRSVNQKLFSTTTGVAP